MAQNRADSHLSAARIVRWNALTEPGEAVQTPHKLSARGRNTASQTFMRTALTHIMTRAQAKRHNHFDYRLTRPASRELSSRARSAEKQDNSTEKRRVMCRHDSTNKNTLLTKTPQATWTASRVGGTRPSTTDNLRASL